MSFLIDIETHRDLIISLSELEDALKIEFNSIPLYTSVVNALKADKICTRLSHLEKLKYKMQALEPIEDIQTQTVYNGLAHKMESANHGAYRGTKK